MAAGFSSSSFVYLANGSQDFSGVAGRAGHSFFNPVNFVMFVSLSARNMNEAMAQFVIGLMAISGRPACRRIF